MQEVALSTAIPTDTQPTFETVALRAGDGLALNLKHLVPAPRGGEGPVLMVAGTGTRANVFSPPTRKTLPEMLYGAGFDVWILNWRSSIDLPAVA
jgi:hypothetical protein